MATARRSSSASRSRAPRRYVTVHKLEMSEVSLEVAERWEVHMNDLRRKRGKPEEFHRREQVLRMRKLLPRLLALNSSRMPTSAADAGASAAAVPADADTADADAATDASGVSRAARAASIGAAASVARVPTTTTVEAWPFDCYTHGRRETAVATTARSGGGGGDAVHPSIAAFFQLPLCSSWSFCEPSRGEWAVRGMTEAQRRAQAEARHSAGAEVTEARRERSVSAT